MSSILVNQIGFLPHGVKEVTFRDSAIGATFRLMDDRTGGTVAEFLQSPPQDQINTGERCSRGNFSSFDRPGIYRITAGEETSCPFEIGEHVYDALIRDLTYMLHLQRCGQTLTEEEAGVFAHASCHDTPARIYGTDDHIDVNGGWHDAGDYGRYIVPAAKAVTDVLLGYLAAPGSLSFSMGFPASTLPDPLEEVRYEIDWMRKMQRADGAVYHKVTCAGFPEMDACPDEEREELIVSPVSNAAAACFAATMAVAYRVYGSFDRDYAHELLSAGRRAFDWLDTRESDEGYHDPADIRTGEYRDDNWRDEWFWAAAALFYATGEERYGQTAASLCDEAFTNGLGWEETGFYGGAFYIHSPAADPGVREKIVRRMETAADAAMEKGLSDAYGCANTVGRFRWGSNCDIANAAMLFYILSDLEDLPEDKKNAYRRMAEKQVNYLLGQNGTGYCFVTGHGTVCPVSPHHRPSVAKKTPMKGMLVGGADDALQDAHAAEHLKGRAPALCYADDWRSYSTNEITIYWNSPLIYDLARMIG